MQVKWDFGDDAEYEEYWESDENLTIGIGIELCGSSSSISVFSPSNQESPHRIVFNDLSGIDDGVFPAISLAGEHSSS